MKFREDIQEGMAITQRWLGWGDILSGERRIGSYFFVQIPSYKMVNDWSVDRMVWGKLTFAEVLRYDGRTPAKYIFDYWPIYDIAERAKDKA